MALIDDPNPMPVVDASGKASAASRRRHVRLAYLLVIISGGLTVGFIFLMSTNRKLQDSDTFKAIGTGVMLSLYGSMVLWTCWGVPLVGARDLPSHSKLPMAKRLSGIRFLVLTPGLLGLAAAGFILYRYLDEGGLWVPGSSVAIAVPIGLILFGASWFVMRRTVRMIRRACAGCSRCFACGYDLRGSAGLKCPECGHDSTVREK